MNNCEYQIVYADPPWSFKNKNTGGSLKSGASAKYPVMSLDDICRLPVDKITHENCVLFMWWVGSQPLEAIRVVHEWGFTIKTMTGFTWVKTTSKGNLHFGMGFWTRSGSEYCLIAVKGRPRRQYAGVRSVGLTYEDSFEEQTAFAQNEYHSKKPDIFRNRIVELMGDKPRIELFAREKFPGWEAFGNEISDSFIFP